VPNHHFEFAIDSELREQAFALEKSNQAHLKARVNQLLMLANAVMVCVLIALFTILLLCAFVIDRGSRLAAISALLVGVPTLAAFAYAIHSVIASFGSDDDEFVLTPSNAPELFRDIQALLSKLALPPVDAVYLICDLNAYMQLQPSTLGWRKDRHILGIGLPLLMSLSKSETMSVIAHEFGHYAGKDGHTFGRIYRARSMWFETAWRLAESENLLRKPALKFLNWFLPKLDAWSFPLARAQEFAADRFAARATSNVDAAAALYRISLGAHLYCRHVAPGIWNDFELHASFANQRLKAMATQLKSPPVPGHHELELLLERTEASDTHPCLSERLRQLGQPMPPCIAPLQQCALEQWFGDKANALIDAFTRFHFGDFQQAAAANLATPNLATSSAKLAMPSATANVDRSKLALESEQKLAQFASQTPSVQTLPSHWERLYQARQLIQSEPTHAQAQLIDCAKRDVFVAPHALRSLAELFALQKRFDHEQKTQEMIHRADARVDAWQHAAELIDVTETALRASTLAPLLRSKIILALKKFGADSASLVAATVPGFEQYEHLFFVLEFDGDFDGASAAICTVPVDGFTHHVIDADELDTQSLAKIRAVKTSKLY
jgi:Zn-dependent protease with chaperone function